MTDPQPPVNPQNPPADPPNPPTPPAPPAPPANPGSEVSLEGLGKILGGMANAVAALPEKFADVLEERAPKPPEPAAPPANPPADPPKNPQGVKVDKDKAKGKTFAERWFG